MNEITSVFPTYSILRFTLELSWRFRDQGVYILNTCSKRVDLKSFQHKKKKKSNCEVIDVN